jgi:cystathionine beta-lyase
MKFNTKVGLTVSTPRSRNWCSNASLSNIHLVQTSWAKPINPDYEYSRAAKPNTFLPLENAFSKYRKWSKRFFLLALAATLFNSAFKFHRRLEIIAMDDLYGGTYRNTVYQNI